MRRLETGYFNRGRICHWAQFWSSWRGFKLVFNNQIHFVLHFALGKSIIMRSCSFCDTASCRLMVAIRRFGETYSIHLHGRRVSKARKGNEAGSKQRELRAAHYWCLLHAPFLLCSLIDRQNGSSETPAVFPRTTRNYIPEVELFIATAVIPWRPKKRKKENWKMKAHKNILQLQQCNPKRRHRPDSGPVLWRWATSGKSTYRWTYSGSS